MDWVLVEKDGDYIAIPTRVVKANEVLGKVFTGDKIRILTALAEESTYPRRLAEKLGMKEQIVYYHLATLRDAGLVYVSKKEEVKGAVAKYYSTNFKSVSLVFSENGISVKPSQILRLGESVMEFLTPFIEKGEFNSKIIVGSPDIHGPYRAQSRDTHYAVELAAFLGSISGKVGSGIVKLDTEVREDDLKGNMIVVGGPVTNMVANRINDILPLRFDMKEQNRILSLITGRIYYEDECGIVVKTTNPFNPQSRILLLAGKRFQGTKAAILAVTKHIDDVAKNNSFDPSVPARVVMGYDLDGDGVIDDVEFLE
ncbi:MAG: S-layer protein [Candidatus Freyarchaeota archaeon]|nr:S-layer protein [Candidatus Jordarchaeia archaeon]